MFTPYPTDPIEAGLRRIDEALKLPGTASNIILEADDEQWQEWLRWSQCTVTNIPRIQFSDLFPPAAIEQYRDDNGKRLPGFAPIVKAVAITAYPEAWHAVIAKERAAGHFVLSEPEVYGQYIAPDEPTLTLNEQEIYVRCRVLPAAVNVLVHALYTGYNALRCTREEDDNLRKYGKDMHNVAQALFGSGE